MKLWLISQTTNRDYDTWDSAVVVAADEEHARKIHPSDDPPIGRYTPKWWEGEGNLDRTWCDRLEDVKVAYIGEASDLLTAGTVVCASFNAG